MLRFVRMSGEKEGMMPYNSTVAKRLAADPSVDSATLDAAIAYLERKIAQARQNNDPVPFSRYRTRLILKKTLGIRNRQI